MHFEIPVHDGFGKNGKKLRKPNLTERQKQTARSAAHVDARNDEGLHNAALDAKYKAQQKQHLKIASPTRSQESDTDSAGPSKGRRHQPQDIAIYQHRNSSPHKVGMKPLVPYRGDSDAMYKGNRERDFQTIHEELTHLRQANKDFERIIALLKADAVRLKQEIIVKGKDCEHFRDQFEQLRVGKDRDSNSHSAARQEWGRIIADRDHSIEKLQRDLGEARQLITTLTIQNERLKDDMKQDTSIDQEERLALHDELKRLRYDYDRLVEATASKEKSAQNYSDEAGSTIAQLKQQVHELTVERNTLKVQLTSSLSSKEAEQLRSQVEDLQRTKDRQERNMKSDLADANDQVAILRKDKQRLVADVQELEEKLWKAERSGTNKQRHCSSSRRENSSPGSSDSDDDNPHRKRRGSQIDAASSRSRTRLSQAKKDDVEFAAAAAATLRRKLTDEEAVREDLEKRLSAERRHREDAEAEISKLMGEHIKEVKRLEEDIRDKEAEMRNVRGRQEASAALLEELKKDRAAARQLESTLNASLSRQTSTHHATQKELDGAVQEKTKLYQQNQAQHELLVKAEDEVIEYRLKLEHVEAEWHSSEESRRQLVDSVNRLERALAEQQEVNASLLLKLQKGAPRERPSIDSQSSIISTSRRASVNGGEVDSSYNAGGSPAHIASLQHQVANLQRDLDEERAVSTQLLNDLKEAKSKAADNGSDNDAFLATVKDNMMKSIAEVEAREIEAKKVSEGLSNQLVSTQQQLEAEADEKAQALELLAELESKGAELEEKMFEMREELKETQGKCVELQREQEAVRRELRGELEEKEGQLAALEEELTIAAEKVQKVVKDAADDHEKMAKEISTQANAYTYMEEKHSKATEKISHLEKQLSALDADIVNRNSEIESLRSQLVQKDASIAELTSSLDELKGQLASAHDKSTALDASLKELQRNYEAAQGTITDKMGEADTLKRLLTAQKTAMEEASKTHLAEAKRQQDSFAQERNVLNAKINELTKAIQLAEEAARATLEAHNKELAVRDAKAAEWKATEETLGATIESLKKDRSAERKNFVDQLDIDKKAMLARVRTAESKNKDLAMSAEIKAKQLKEEMQLRKDAEKALKEGLERQENEQLIAMKALTDDYEAQLEVLKKKAGDEGDDVGELKRRLAEALRELKHIKQVQLHW